MVKREKDRIEQDATYLLERFKRLEDGLLQTKSKTLTNILKEMKTRIDNVFFVHSLPSEKESNEDIKRRLASHVVPGLSKRRI